MRRHTSDRYEADAQEQPRAADERWARYRYECRDDQKRAGRSAEQTRLKAEKRIAIVQRRTLYLKHAEIRAQTDNAACQQDILTAQKKVAARPGHWPPARHAGPQAAVSASSGRLRRTPSGPGPPVRVRRPTVRRSPYAVRIEGEAQSAAISARGAAEAEGVAP